MPLGARELLLVLRARDEASRAMHSLSRSMGSLSAAERKAAQANIERGRTLSSVGVGIMAVGAAGAKVLYDWTKAAVKYNQESALTLTQVDKQKISLEDIKKVGRDVAAAIPAPFKEMQGALYDIFSSMDVNLGGARKLLTEFSKAAVAGQVDLRDASRATIGILNAYRMKADQVNRVNDVMFQLVRKGVGTYGQFANVIGRAVPSAVRAGQSIEDLAGMMAFLTRNGLSAAMASASAARALDAISNPETITNFSQLGKFIEQALGTKRVKELKDAGVHFDKLKVSIVDANGKFRPMNQIMTDLGKRFRELGLTAPQVSAVLKGLFKGAGGTIQARRFFDVAVKNFEQLNSLTGDMAHSTGALGQAYSTMAKQPQSQLQLLINNFEILKTEMGESLLPIVLAVTKALTGLFKWFNDLGGSTKNIIVWVTVAVTALALLSGTVLVVVGAIAMMSGAMAVVGITLGTLAAIVGIVILAIAALVAIAIVVIKNWTPISGFFVNLWNIIKAAFISGWQSIMGWATTAGTAIKNVWDAIAAAGMAAWNVISPILMFFANVLKSILVPAWKLVASVVAFAWDIIVTAAKLAWAILKVIFTLVKIAIMLMAFGFKVAAALILTAWDIISSAAKKAWKYVLEPVFRFIEHWLKGPLKDAFNFFKTFAKDAWNSTAAVIRTAGNVIGNVFKVLRTGVDLVRRGFDLAVKGIISIWNKIKDAARAPVKWVIDVVYRGGIVKVWNAIRKVVPRLPALPDGPRLAAGGILPGYTPGRDIWKLPLAMFSGGEAIMRPEVTKALGKGWIYGANNAARRGGVGAVGRFLAGDPEGLVHGFHHGRNFGGPQGGFSSGGILHFDGGGILGKIGHVLKSGAGIVTKGLTGLARSILAKGAKWVAEKILKPLLNRLPSGTDLPGAIGGLAKSGIEGFLNFIIKVIDPNISGGALAVVKAARSQIGVPYSWGGGGRGGPSRGIAQGRNTVGFDCSGLTEYAWWKGAHKEIGGTTGPQAAGSRSIGGPRAGALGFIGNPIHHVMLGSDKHGFVIQAPFTGSHVQEVRRSSSNWRWPRNADRGAYLRPGLNVIRNATGGGRERILSPAETAAYESGRGGAHQNFFINTQEINPRKHAAELGWELAKRSAP
jgi:TP901 family phage tail tape measure protein